MVADDFRNHEIQELLSEFRVKMRFVGEGAQALDLRLLAIRIAGRQLVLGLEDSDALANLASVLVEIEEDQVLLHSLGSPYYVPNEENGMIRAHPAVNRISVNRQRAQALLGEFGLTPAARSKVSAGKPAEANPFAALG